MSETTYQVVDRKTKENIGKPMKNRRRAYSKANRLDSQYGACRYSVTINWAAK